MTPAKTKTVTENVMRQIRLEKITLNIGTGAEPENVKRAVALLNTISNLKPIETLSKKRLAAWKIRPGLPIGAKVTIRGKAGHELLVRLLQARENKVQKDSFTENGFSFGVNEYIDIPGVKYDPKIGMIGLDVCVTLERPGFRVKRRKLKSTKLSKKHTISAEDAAAFATEKLGVILE